MASELGFVCDVLDSNDTFGPDSNISIAWAVTRFMRIPERGLPLHDASDFMKYIMQDRNAN